jgi:hypothetical protein
MARRVLPIVVVVWASLAMIGAVHLAKEATAKDPAAKAGLGLCAVSLAFFVKKARGGTSPQVPAGGPVPESLSSLRSATPTVLRLPPSTGPPLPLLLRVSRT